MPVDPEIAALLDFLASVGTKPMSESTPEEARRAFRALAVDSREVSLLPLMESVDEVQVDGADGGLTARVYRRRPLSEGTLPTVVLFHGGGWVVGDLDTHDLTARTLAELCSAVVVSVAYRLAPEHPFPAAAEDAIAATRWAYEHLAELGGEGTGSGLAVAGDSAGGNLAAVAAQSARDAGIALLGQLLIYPSVDGDRVDVSAYPSRTANGTGYFLDLPTMAWFGEQYVGADPGEVRDDPRLSPIRGDLTRLAPTVLVVGDLDPLLDEGTAYAEALHIAGVSTQVRVFHGLIHGFVDMGRHSRAAQAAIEETCRLFRDVLHGLG